LQCMQILYIYSTSMFYIHILSHLLHIPPKYSFLHILTSSFACSSLPCKVIFFCSHNCMHVWKQRPLLLMGTPRWMDHLWTKHLLIMLLF
jgi:hypothetical protein